MNRDNKYWAMIHYQRAMYKRIGYKKTRVRQIIKSRDEVARYLRRTLCNKDTQDTNS